jgi:hypothetical protein
VGQGFNLTINGFRANDKNVFYVCIYNHRLESWKDNQVTLFYFDNKANKASRLPLELAELNGRFLLRILSRIAQRLFIECHKKACLRKDQTTG